MRMVTYYKQSTLMEILPKQNQSHLDFTNLTPNTKYQIKFDNFLYDGAIIVNQVPVIEKSDYIENETNVRNTKFYHG